MLIQDGIAVPDTDRVLDNIAFAPGDRNTFAQKSNTWAGVGIHWTGGEGLADRVIRTLDLRGLSVHFIINPAGTIVQTADLSTRCAHIGTPGNDRFIGIEVVCRGFATKEALVAAKLRDPSLRERDELDWETPRDTYRDTIGDRAVHMAGFNPGQIESLLWLCETLADLYDFPRIIPHRRLSKREETVILPVPNPDAYIVTDGNGHRWVPSFKRSPNRYFGLAKTFTGVLGHCHVHKTKYDPGSQIFYKLWAEGWNPMGEKLFP